MGSIVSPPPEKEFRGHQSIFSRVFEDRAWRPTALLYQTTMKSTALAGVLLIVLGVAALVYQGITYTKRDTIVNFGPAHVEADTQHTIPVPPIIGIVAVAGGIYLVVAGGRKAAI